MLTNQSSDVPHSNVKIINKAIAYQGYFSISKYRLQYRLFSGEWSQPIEREVFEHGRSVGVLLFDPNLDQVVMIEQFRLGALRDEKSPWLLEIVAGMVEANEILEEVAKREAVEEANIVIQEIIPITEYWVSPGGSSEKMALYCAKVDSQCAGGIHGLVEEHEDIRASVMSIDALWQALDNHTLCNGSTIIAVQWLRLNHCNLKQKWQSKTANGD